MFALIGQVAVLYIVGWLVVRLSRGIRTGLRINPRQFNQLQEERELSATYLTQLGKHHALIIVHDNHQPEEGK